MAIRETSRGYYVEVYLGKDPLTKKKIRKTKLFSPHGNRQALKEAKEFEAEWLKMSANGEIEYNNKMLLSEYLDYWYKNYVELKVAYQTKKRYITFCKCIKKGIGHIRLSKLAAPIIQQFYTNLLSETIKRKDGTIVRRYSNGTILKTHKMLHLALKWAVTWQMLRLNPADNVTPPSDDDREINVWTLDEIDLFLNIIKNRSQLYSAVFLAYRTGMREAEISALKWDNVDFDNRILHVRHSMVEKKPSELTPEEIKEDAQNNFNQESKIKLVPEEPKTKNSKRDINLDDETVDWLKSLKITQDEANKINNINYEYVCCWEDGRPLRPQYITKSFSKVVKRNKDKLKQITFHGLRHTHASILFDIGETSNVISKRLGHARTSITDDIYIHIKKQMQRDAADKFGEALKKHEEKRTDRGQM